MLLGIDTGGTFTDFVLLGGGGVRFHKVLSTPEAPERAIIDGIEAMGMTAAAQAGRLRIVHGSTIATNAALERQGARTVYVTHHGLTDVLTLARQNRVSLYELQPELMEPPVPPALTAGVGGRLDPAGREIEPLEAAELEALTSTVRAMAPEAIAINFLYAWIDDRHERRAEAALQQALGDGVFIARSSFVLPEYREYERGIATWLNAWLGPRVEGYLARLAAALAPSSVAIMQSSGGTMEAEIASRRAVNLLVSGPAGGINGARFAGRSAGADRLLTFDMGGTSTDVALIDGEPELTTEGRLGPWPVAVPMLDIHTIGAGGGSIAHLDAGGALRVGPRSAGAAPGPACYGRGGEAPTVTDAHVVLGHIRADARLGGELELRPEQARAALESLARALEMTIERLAEGILAIANEHMTRALRVMSIERGRDPRQLVLCCFGGAGGLHVCALAEQLGMDRALVPCHGGVLSALGMLTAPPERQLSRTLQRPLATQQVSNLDAAIAELHAQGTSELAYEGHATDRLTTEASLELRYRGQAYALQLPWEGNLEAAEAGFHAAHRERYGHTLATAVELVNVRVRIRAPTVSASLPRIAAAGATAPTAAKTHVYGIGDVAVHARDGLGAGACIEGPALIEERVATTWLAPGWRAAVTPVANLLLERAI